MPCPECDIVDPLTIHPTLTPNSGYPGQTVAYHAHISGGLAPYSISWSFEGGSPSTGSLSESGTVTFNDPGPGRPWSIILNVMDSCGNTVSDTLGVTINEYPMGCSYRWNGTSWVLVNTSLMCDCSGASPPGTPGTTVGQIVAVDCATAV